MKMKRIAALSLALLMLLSLAACGSSAAAKRSENGYASYAVSDAAPAYEPEAPMMAEEYAMGGFAAAESAEAEAVPGAAEVSLGDIAVDKIIYSASATVETTDFDDTISKLEALIAHYGGFIESSSVSGNNYYHSSHGYASSRYADYRIRIPSRDFAAVMGSLSELGNVPYSNTYTENITTQYYDAQARLNAYRTQEKSLLDMMEKAETVEDLLKIQAQLTEVRYQIESIQSTLTNWDRQVSYSTISLSVQEVQEYTPEAKLSFLSQLGLAISRGFRSVGEFFRNLLLWLVEALPALVLLAVFAVIVLVLVRRIVRRARDKRTAKPAAPAPEESETK